MEKQKSLQIACITLNPRGEERANRVKSAFERQSFAWLRRPLARFQSKSLPPALITVVRADIPRTQLAAIFQEYDGLVFFCATGTAVRLSAPFFQDTINEPAIVVVDECGRYAISLTAGHLGHERDLAEMISGILGCQAIVTTASDGCGIEGIDLFARKHGLLIENLRHAAHITTLMVEGAPIRLISEVPAVINYRNLVEEHPDACIYVTSQAQIECSLPYCMLRPRNLNIGLSCRGASKGTILHAILHVFEAQNLSLNCIRMLSAIDSARHETGLREAKQALQCEAQFFDHYALKRLPANILGRLPTHANMADLSICERCACLAGGELIVEKVVVGGIGLAVAREFNPVYPEQ